MKRFLLVLVSFLFLAGVASGLPITDNFIGGNDHGHGDVIGDSNKFGISEAEVTLNNGILQIDISTNFAGLGDNGLFSSYTYNGRGIGYGDLFLTSNYDESLGDNNIWEYAFNLDNRWSANATNQGDLFYVTDGQILFAEDFMSGATYRDTQEVAFSPNNGANFISQGTWLLGDDTISFIMDISNTALMGNSIGIHWGMTCANDVIEGNMAPVPEPATMVLLGTGLIGLSAISRRRTFKKDE